MVALDYTTLLEVWESYCEKYGIEPGQPYTPFYFAYPHYFYGLLFRPIKLDFRSLQTEHDLFTLLFELSFVEWAQENELAITRTTLAIPENFDPATLPLTYQHSCRDPRTRVLSFAPRELDLESYSLEDCRILLQRFGFDLPSPLAESVFAGRPHRLQEWYFAPLVAEYGFNLGQRCYPGADRIPLAEYLPRYVLEYALKIHERALPPTYPAALEDVPGTNGLPAYSPDFTAWRERYREWLIDQAAILLLFTQSVESYFSAAYQSINAQCRSGSSRDLLPAALGLLRAFGLTSPLPVDTIVYRNLNDVPEERLPIAVSLSEEGFMSTSLLRRAPHPRYHVTRIRYYVPAGTPVLALLVFNDGESELLFPPGTTYTITSRTAVNPQLTELEARIH